MYKKILEITKEAKESIKIASAWIKGSIFEEILNIAKSKNISPEIILRASELRDFLITNDRVFRNIKDINGKIYLCNRLHAKFIIVDNKRAVVGSANFTGCRII
ncbi:phospholipase D-like domain-containing protein [Aquifex aeolicus]|uniref:phospholipase D-like domain-containing protein n=1 Tax=Aquifex aeolicus TaxID=63363 RepID=UPI0013E89D7E